MYIVSVTSLQLLYTQQPIRSGPTKHGLVDFFPKPIGQCTVLSAPKQQLSKSQ